MRTLIKAFSSLLVMMTASVALSTASAQQPRLDRTAMSGKAFQILVSPGDEAKALVYYRDVVTKDTGFVTDPRPALDDLLAFYGYNVSGLELEASDPDVIMKKFPNGQALVSRFFAPKITDVSTSPPAKTSRKIPLTL